MGNVVVRGEEARSLAVQIIADGGTLEEASEKTGFCTNYIRQLAVKAGVRRTVKDKNKELAEKLRNLAASGATISSAAGALAIPYTTASHTSRKYGIRFERKKASGYTKPTARAKWEEMRKLRSAGVSLKEIAKVYGISEGYVGEICRGITDRPADYESRLKAALRVMEQNAPRFEYVTGYVDVDHPIIIRCKECGNEFSQSFVSIRKGHTIKCEVCAAREREKQKLEEAERRKKEREQRKELKRREKALHSPAVQLEMGVCECCGSVFVNGRGGKRYCSTECALKVSNARAKDKRVKRIQATKRDPITLERVFEKESGVCYLCGGLCDKDAYIIRDDGVFIALDNYPSIEHVVPLSRGGTHTWDNVRLAHRICNSIKGANVAG